MYLQCFIRKTALLIQMSNSDSIKEVPFKNNTQSLVSRKSRHFQVLTLVFSVKLSLSKQRNQIICRDLYQPRSTRCNVRQLEFELLPLNFKPILALVSDITTVFPTELHSPYRTTCALKQDTKNLKFQSSWRLASCYTKEARCQTVYRSLKTRPEQCT